MKSISSDAWVEKIFAESPYLRALLQLDPTGIGSAYEVMLSHRIAEMRQKRFRNLLEELGKNKEPLSQETIDSDEFLHAFFTIAKIALNSKQEEKIRMLARLLISGIQSNHADNDKFEEFADILEGISLRELRLLLLLRSFEVTRNKSDYKNDLQLATSFWDDFERGALDNFDINPEILRNMLTRLNRTGLFESFIGAYLSYEGGKGKTTPLFEEFVQWVVEESY